MKNTNRLEIRITKEVADVVNGIRNRTLQLPGANYLNVAESTMDNINSVASMLKSNNSDISSLSSIKPSGFVTYIDPKANLN